MLYISELYLGFLPSNLPKKNIFCYTLIQTTAKILKMLYRDKIDLKIPERTCQKHENIQNLPNNIKHWEKYRVATLLLPTGPSLKRETREKLVYKL